MRQKQRGNTWLICILITLLLINFSQRDAFAEALAKEGSYECYGTAKVLTDGTVELTPLDFHQIGSAWLPDRYSTKKQLTVTFSFWAGLGHDNWANGADGIVLMFSQQKGIQPDDGSSLGFIPGAVGVELDSYYMEDDTVQYKHVAIISGSHRNHLATAKDDRVDDENWHNLRIEFDSGQMKVYLDGGLSVQANVDLPDVVYVGAGASTGNGYNRHLVKDLAVSGEKAGGCQLDGLKSAVANGSAIYNGMSYVSRIEEYTRICCENNHGVETVPGKVLEKDKDYSVEYKNLRTGIIGDTTNAGSILVTVTGIGDHCGELTGYFNIIPASISNATINGISNKTYTGSPQTQNPTVKLGDKTLVNGTDYILGYDNNINIGTATVIIEGRGNYAGSISTTFDIIYNMPTPTEVPIPTETPTPTPTEAPTPTPTVAPISATLEVADISTKANAAKTRTGTLKVSYDGDGALAFASSNAKIKVDANGKVTIPKNYVGSATITVTASATEKYEAATATAKVTVSRIANTITANDVTKVSAAQAKAFMLEVKQTGTGRLTFRSSSASVKVTNAGKATIAKNFSGRATITITAAKAGIYDAATKSVVVTVKPAAIAAGTAKNVSGQKIALAWKRPAGAGGYQIQYSTAKNFKNAKSVTVKSAATVKGNLTKLAKGKTYYIRIRAFKKDAGGNIFSKWTSFKAVKVTK